MLRFSISRSRKSLFLSKQIGFGPLNYTHPKFLCTTDSLWRRHDRKRDKGRKKTFIENMDAMFEKSITRLPRIQKLYHQMKIGFRQQVTEYKIWRNVTKTLRNDPKFKTSYHEETAIFNIKSSLLKSTILLPLFMLPMGIFIVFIPVALFPQYLLPRCYWNLNQRQEFFTNMHLARRRKYSTIIHHLSYLRDNDASGAFQRCLEPILTTINDQAVPKNDDLMTFKQWCRNNSNPLHLNDMPPLLLLSFCNANLIWQYQPTPWMVYHLHKRVMLILNLDRKLDEENLIYNLTDEELQDATFLRGLNSAQLSKAANQYWLQNWVKQTKLCDESDISFILHAMVLQSHNYDELRYQRRIFD